MTDNIETEWSPHSDLWYKFLYILGILLYTIFDSPLIYTCLHFKLVTPKNSPAICGPALSFKLSSDIIRFNTQLYVATRIFTT